MKTPIFVVSPIALLAVFLSSCSSVPVTGRKQLNLTSETKVAEMTIAAFEQMKSQMKVSSDPVYTEMLRNVGERISQQVFWDMPLAEWEFVVFDQREVNAFAMPGGKVGVFEGLFQIVKTEDELASVVAHEIAHVTARHTHERITQQMMLNGAGQALGVASVLAGPAALGSGVYVNTTGMIMGIYGMGAQGAAEAWDRDKEGEADRIGIMYMARAGYNPEAAIAVMERMVELESATAQGGSYRSTHPSSVERLDALHGYLADAMAEYEKAKEFQF